MSLLGRRGSFSKHLGFRCIVLFLVIVALFLTSTLVLDRWYSSSSKKISSDWAVENESETPYAAELDGYSNASSQRPPSRLIYPYSVVPGGIDSSAELQAISARDSVVREHYARFDFRKARVVRLRRAQLVYLSYRIGNEIYWTTKKVTLRKGEQVITDGTITARTRCGNRVSALPQRKHSSQQPALSAFDGPIGSSTSMPIPENFHSALENRANFPAWGPAALGPAGPGTLVAGGLAPLGGGFLPIGSPLVPGSRCGKPSRPCGPGSGTGPGPGPGPPSVPVPEPGSADLICAEIVAMILASKAILRK